MYYNSQMFYYAFNIILKSMDGQMDELNRWKEENNALGIF